jgi:hypothetical protein
VTLGAGGPNDDGLVVRVDRVPAARTDRRRARIVLAVVFVAVAAAIGLAVASRPGSGPLSAAASGSPSGAPGPATSAATSASPSVARPSGNVGLRTEHLPDIANRPLPGAPTVAFVRRSGDDAEVLTWVPGETALSVRRTVDAAFSGAFADGQLVLLSPDGGSVLVVKLETLSGEGGDRARLVTAAGGIAWESDRVTGLGSGVWSADGGTLVLSGSHGSWWFLRLAEDGAVTAIEVPVNVDADRAPSTSVSPSPSLIAGFYRLRPIAFSADGRWVYGVRVPFIGGVPEPAVRVSTADAVAEPIAAFPVTGPDRIAAGPSANRFIDTGTGRTVAWGPNASIPGGPPAIEVREPDGTLAYRLEAGVALGMVWAADSSLVVLDADGLPYPNEIRLVAIAPDGTVGLPLLSTGPLESGALLGVRDGYAVVALSANRPEPETEVVVIRLSDGLAAGIRLDEVNRSSILGSGLLP